MILNTNHKKKNRLISYVAAALKGWREVETPIFTFWRDAGVAAELIAFMGYPPRLLFGY